MFTNKIGGVALATLAALTLVACGDGSKESKAPEPQQEAKPVETATKAVRPSAPAIKVVDISQPLPKPRPEVVLVSLTEKEPVHSGLVDPSLEDATVTDPISRLINGNGSIDDVTATVIETVAGQSNLLDPTKPKAETEAVQQSGFAALQSTEQSNSAIHAVGPPSQVTQLLKAVGPQDETKPDDPIETLVEIGTQHLIKSLTQ